MTNKYGWLVTPMDWEKLNLIARSMGEERAEAIRTRYVKSAHGEISVQVAPEESVEVGIDDPNGEGIEAKVSLRFSKGDPLFLSPDEAEVVAQALFDAVEQNRVETPGVISIQEAMEALRAAMVAEEASADDD